MSDTGARAPKGRAQMSAVNHRRPGARLAPGRARLAPGRARLAPMLIIKSINFIIISRASAPRSWPAGLAGRA